MQPRISILLPTRGRTTALENSLHTLMSKASKPDEIEILLGMDYDDVETMTWVEQNIVPKYPQIILHKFQPLGYANINVYTNTLAGLAIGYWMMFWNDDMTMNTDGWDDIIDQHRNHPMPLLRFQVENFNHPFALVPVLKWEWFKVLGSVSYYSHIDRFVYNVIMNIGQDFLVNIPAYITHDRADLTGNNDDETFRATLAAYNENQPQDPFSDDYPVQMKIMLLAVNKLRCYLGKKYKKNIPLFDIEKATAVRQETATSHGSAVAL